MAMKRGFTLIEMVIYFGLSAVALGLIASIFAVAQRTQRQTYSQYLVGGSLSSTIRLLRRELQATALSSIQVYPESGGTSPGLSCASAYDQDGKFTVNGYGVPKWDKNVFYNLDDKGSLARWTKTMNEQNLLPNRATDPASDLGGDRSSTIMSGLLPPNTTVEDFYPASPVGGFEVNFVRRDNGVDSLSRVNPSDSDQYDTHTRLVEVTLRTYDERQHNFSEISFRVCPRY